MVMGRGYNLSPVKDVITLIDFGIPNDSIEFRQKTFASMITPVDGAYIDGATDYNLIIPFAETNSLDTESRLWLAFLYGLSYSCTTVLRLASEFPTLGDVHPKDLKAFWAEYKAGLWFQPDRRYLKNNDQVIPAIKSLHANSQGSLCEYLIPIFDDGFDAVYREIRQHWKYFGPMGAYLFFDAIYGLLPELYHDPKALDWKNCGQTVPEGMAHFLGLDEQALEREPYDIPLYNKTVNHMVKWYGQPKVIIESTLCAFRKLFKGTRYVGYYADRQLEECYATAELLEKHCNIDIWEYRKQACPDMFRGEVHGWNGIRKNRCKLFLTTGTLMGDAQ